QAAVLRVKLRHLEQWTEARRRAAASYGELLADTGIVLPHAPEHCRHVHHIYAIRTRARRQWQEALSEAGIQTGIHYPTPVHLLPAHAALGYRPGDFPLSEEAANQVLSLPMFPELSEAQRMEVAEAVRALAVRGSKLPNLAPTG